MPGKTEIGQHIVGHLWGVPFYWDTLLLSWLVMAVLVLGSWLITRHLHKLPGRAQNALEAVFEFLQRLLAENMAPAGRSAFPFIATLFLFILFANLLGVTAGLVYPPLRSPTNDLNVTLALALIVLLLTQVYAFKVLGARRYLKSMINPLYWIETLTRPITLAFRLFGNIFAGEVLIVILGRLVPVVVPSLWAAFSIFIGVIQAYLFTMLAIAYISAAVEE